jgi:hypothetical protein
MAFLKKHFIACQIRILIVATLYIVLQSGSAYADSIFMRTGGFWNGIIHRSTGDSVRLNLQGGHLDLASADIDSIRFDASDTIALHNGEIIIGKTCRSVNDSLLIVTGEGLRLIAKDSVGTVTRNSGGPLTVPQLPETDHQFAPTDEGVIGDHPPGMVFRVNGSLFIPFLANRNAGLRYASSDGRPDRQYCYGVGFGVTEFEPLTFFVQYERYTTGMSPDISAGSGGSTEAKYECFYGSAELQFRIPSHSEWSYSIALDLGIQKAEEEIHDALGAVWNVSESSFIARPRFEVEYAFPRSNFAIRSGVGYLLPTGNLLRFTGSMFSTSILIRLPFVGGPI